MASVLFAIDKRRVHVALESQQAEQYTGSFGVTQLYRTTAARAGVTQDQIDRSSTSFLLVWGNNAATVIGGRIERNKRDLNAAIGIGLFAYFFQLYRSYRVGRGLVSTDLAKSGESFESGRFLVTVARPFDDGRPAGKRCCTKVEYRWNF